MAGKMSYAPATTSNYVLRKFMSGPGQFRPGSAHLCIYIYCILLDRLITFFNKQLA